MLDKEKVENIRHFRNVDSTDFRDIVDFLSVCQGHQLANEDDTVLEARAKTLKILNVYTQRTRESDLQNLGGENTLCQKITHWSAIRGSGRPGEELSRSPSALASQCTQSS